MTRHDQSLYATLVDGVPHIVFWEGDYKGKGRYENVRYMSRPILDVIALFKASPWGSGADVPFEPVLLQWMQHTDPAST